MSTHLQLCAAQIDALREVGNIGAGNAATALSQMMGGISAPGSFTEMELSALQEIGNIMTGSYLGALSQITGLRLEPTPPAVGVDLAGALVGAARAEVAMVSDTALLLESSFGDEGMTSAGDFISIPISEALTLVLDRLGVGE